MALQTAIEEDIEFRKALPLGFQNHIGMSNSEKVSYLCAAKDGFSLYFISSSDFLLN